MSGQGRVLFVGCGPGAPDLLTLRAADAIATADIVVWGRSLLTREAVLAHASTETEVIAWPPATMTEVLAAYDRARDEGLVVARLKSGDPAIFGEGATELQAVAERGLEWEMVPGVSAVCAAAAAFKVELTAAGTQVVLARSGEVAQATTVALFMAGRDPAGPQRELLARGLDAGTTCGIARQVSRPGEVLVRCRLEKLAETLQDLGLDGMTVVLTGI